MYQYKSKYIVQFRITALVLRVLPIFQLTSTQTCTNTHTFILPHCMSLCIICRLTHSGRVCSVHLDARKRRGERKTIRTTGQLRTSTLLSEADTLVRLSKKRSISALFTNITAHHISSWNSTVPPYHLILTNKRSASISAITTWFKEADKRKRESALD